jgi:hypothetical protein
MDMLTKKAMEILKPENQEKMTRGLLTKILQDRGITPSEDASMNSLMRVLRADIEKEEKFGEPKAAGGPIKKKKKMKKKMGHGGKMKKMYAKGGGIRKPKMGVN